MIMTYGQDDSLKKVYLQDYYRSKGLVIVGLSDSQGVKTSGLFGKGLLDQLAATITDEDKGYEVINAFISKFNKTEDINYILQGNLSIRDIKDLHVNSTVKNLEATMSNYCLPKFLGKFGYISRALHPRKKEDDFVQISSSIRNADEPIIIYSCGASDLSSAELDKLYLEARQRKDPETRAMILQERKPLVEEVAAKAEENIRKILSLNSKADIYVLSVYDPFAIDNSKLYIYNELVRMYNSKLKELCDRYNLSYIDTELVVNKYNSDKNVRTLTIDNESLLSEIIDRMHENKSYNPDKKINKVVYDDIEVTDHGLLDLYIDLQNQIKVLKKYRACVAGIEREPYTHQIDDTTEKLEIVGNIVKKRG